MPRMSPDEDPRGLPSRQVLRPKNFTVAMSPDHLTIIVTFHYDSSWRDLDTVPTIRLWYIDALDVAAEQIATAEGLAVAKQHSSTLLASFLVTAQSHKVSLGIGDFPDLFSNGGWLWADSIGSGNETYFPSSVAVLIPRRNVYTDLPVNQVPTDMTTPVMTITPVVIDGRPYRELLFSWMNPQPLDTFVHLLIVMYNYRNVGAYENLVRFRTVASEGSFGMASNIMRGQNNQRGPVYLVTDFDGLHNVTFYFVVENEARQHDSRYVTIPAATVLAVGGV